MHVFVEKATHAARIELIRQSVDGEIYYDRKRDKVDGDIDLEALVKAMLRVVMEPVAENKGSFPELPSFEGMSEAQICDAAREYSNACVFWYARK